MNAAQKEKDRAIEKGSVIFTAAVFIPFLFFLISLSLDVYSYYKSVAVEQGLLDSASLLAAKQLPDSARARFVATKYLETFSRELKNQDPYRGSLSVGIDEAQNSVTLTLRGNAPIFFAKIIPKLFQGLSIPEGIPFKLESEARTSPRDAVVFVDNGNYLAPSLASNEIWGWKLRDKHDHLGYGYLEIFLPTTDPGDSSWRAAKFFHDFGNVNALPGSERTRRRIQYTQQCFNPVFSALKDAAIHLYDEIAASYLNSVAVLSGPNASGQIERLRSLKAGGFFGGESEGRIENSNFYPVRDQHCLAAAERVSKEMDDWNASHPYTPGENSNFELPPARLWHAFPSFLGGSLSRIRGFSSRDTSFMFTYDDGSLIPGREDSLTLREALWSRAVNPTRRLNFGRAVNEVVDELLGEGMHLRDAERGALKDATRSSAYMFLGGFPYINGVRYPAPDAKDGLEEMLDLANRRARDARRKIALYIIIPRTAEAFLSCEHIQCEDFEDDFQELVRQVRPHAGGSYGSEKEREKWNYLRVVPIRAPDPGSIATDLMAHLPLSERGVVLMNKEAVRSGDPRP